MIYNTLPTIVAIQKYIIVTSVYLWKQWTLWWLTCVNIVSCEVFSQWPPFTLSSWWPPWYWTCIIITTVWLYRSCWRALDCVPVYTIQEAAWGYAYHLTPHLSFAITKEVSVRSDMRRAEEHFLTSQYWAVQWWDINAFWVGLDFSIEKFTKMAVPGFLCIWLIVLEFDFTYLVIFLTQIDKMSIASHKTRYIVNQ